MSIHEIEKAITELPPSQQSELFAWLDEYRAEREDDQAAPDEPLQETAYDRIKHLAGIGKGPGDLSTNPKYMEGFGQRSLR